MPQILYTIDEYVTKERQRDTYWMVFNTVYNDVHTFGKKITGENAFDKYLNKDFTDYEKREEFLKYMNSNFPDIKLIEVFDLVSSNYLQFPYLGSIAIECEKDDIVFKALSEKYGNPYEDAISNNAVFWVLDYENAKKFHDEKLEAINAELYN
ncbi:hypothetical protein [Aliarcobacter butzleri]|uniref:hypothetical protein n=1 Tax=Aliarcobacter butzleri TaxID=28197 RepID=UPI0012FCA326|nr:hypothetical protein [Aliarcobacter butzleri]